MQTLFAVRGIMPDYLEANIAVPEILELYGRSWIIGECI